jgi:hypothetical protein
MKGFSDQSSRATMSEAADVSSWPTLPVRRSAAMRQLSGKTRHFVVSLNTGVPDLTPTPQNDCATPTTTRVYARNPVSWSRTSSKREFGAWHLTALLPKARQLLIPILSSAFCFSRRKCKLDQAPNCFRPRGPVILLLGPAVNLGPERGRNPQCQHRILPSRWAPAFFLYYGN